jgi:hypothetical protein
MGYRGTEPPFDAPSEDARCLCVSVANYGFRNLSNQAVISAHISGV